MLMSELFSQNRTRGGYILCVTWIQFLIIKNGCVGEYIFFSSGHGIRFSKIAGIWAHLPKLIMAISKSTDSSSIRYLLNVRALTPFVCPCSRFLSIPAYRYGSFYHLLWKGKPKIHILDCCSFVSYFFFWGGLLLIPNSNLSETVHQHTPVMK